jgi:hypothetical protein
VPRSSLGAPSRTRARPSAAYILNGGTVPHCCRSPSGSALILFANAAEVCLEAMADFCMRNGEGHRLRQATKSAKHQPVAPSHRPAPAPPPAGASRPPGQALAFVVSGDAGSCGRRSAWPGKRGAFSDLPKSRLCIHFDLLRLPGLKALAPPGPRPVARQVIAGNRCKGVSPQGGRDFYLCQQKLGGVSDKGLGGSPGASS